MYVEVKTKWLAALRSGEYEQGEEHLRQNNRFCCLGVLCDLAERSGVRLKTLLDDTGVMQYDEESGVLPKSVQEWAGLQTALPEVVLNDGRSVGLDVLNDDGTPFPQLADLIERSL